MTTQTEIRPTSSTDKPTLEQKPASERQIRDLSSLRLLGNGRHPGGFREGVELRHPH